MIFRNIIRYSLPLALLCSVPAYAQATADKPAVDTSLPSQTNRGSKKLPLEFSSLIKQGDYKALRDKILAEIKKRNDANSNMDELLKDPQYRQMIAAAEVIRVTGPDQMAQFQKEVPHAAAFLNSFLGDTKWVELYLGAGLVPENTDAGLKVMADIWKAHGRDQDFEDYLSLTCGLASIWGAGGTMEQCQIEIKQNNTSRNPVRRYEFFRKQQKANKLHEGFMKLRPWEIRFVAGHNWDDDSYEWIVKQVNLPPRRYVDACWFAEYTGTNFFGDTIQGPLFHMPWRDESNMAENMKMRGGVCGGLSTIGCLAANAHGIPAFTVGQPGHCAYSVRTKRGEWKGGFGGPDGGSGNNIFGDRMPTSYLLMETVFADDATIDQAYRYAFQARAMEQLEQPALAVKAWEKALELSPVHAFFRKDLHRLMNEKGDMKPEDWFAYAKNTLPQYQGNGFAAAEIFAEAEQQFIGAIPEQSRLEWLKSLHELIAGTQSSWAVKCDDLLDRQIGYLTTDQGKQQFLADVFIAHLNKGDGTNFGQALEWAVKTFVESGQEGIFSNAFGLAAKSAAPANGADGSNVDTKKLREAYSKAILAAETAHSISAFQALSNAADQFSDTNKDEKNFSSEPLPGTLMPPTGLVRLSTSRWDDPIEHRNLLMPCGGKSHTEEETNPHIIVQLTETVKLSGLIINKRDANQERMKKMRVSTSTDGATWFPLADTDDMPKEWRIENKKDASAKWIKIEAFNEKPDFLHLRHILVYKK